MRKSSLSFILALSLCSAATEAQEKNLFNHMDFGVTLGTTGIGFDVATPVTDYVRLRTGMSYVPKIEVPMTFGIQVGDDPATSKSKFDRLSGLLSNFTGKPVSQEVAVTGRPTFWNWNVMVDVFPLKNNRHWHVTAGFYLGSEKVAESFNKTESMSSLVALDIYNNLYERVKTSPVLNDEWYFYEHNALEVMEDIQLLKDLGMINSKDMPAELASIYLDPNNNVVKNAYQTIADYGRMGMRMGTYKRDIVDKDGNVIHKKGDAYIMETNGESMVKADMKVNAFKPYIGVGYDGRMLKNDKRLYIGFDAGIMMWGGTPSLTTHDGTDLINDVENIPGKVGDYVSTIEKFKVFPMVNVRLSYKLF